MSTCTVIMYRNNGVYFKLLHGSNSVHYTLLHFGV